MHDQWTNLELRKKYMAIVFTQVNRKLEKARKICQILEAKQ